MSIVRTHSPQHPVRVGDTGRSGQSKVRQTSGSWLRLAAFGLAGALPFGAWSADDGAPGNASLTVPDHAGDLDQPSLSTAFADGQAPPAGAVQPDLPELDKVIVTAQRRAEDLYRVPVSVAVVDGQTLHARGAPDVTEVARLAPNVSWDSIVTSGGSTATSIYIRGIGQSDMLQTTDPGVGLFVDGVYFARALGSLLDVAEIERVEVLRGPQGTLFGRNTMGGAIHVTTRAPGTERAFSGRATVGSDDRVEYVLRADLPISQALRSKISLASFEQDGYIDRPAVGDQLGNRNRQAGRAQLAYEPGGRFSAAFSADYTRVREAGPPATLVQVVQLCPAGVPNAIGGCHGNVLPGAPPSQAFQFNNIPPVNFAAGGSGVGSSIYDARYIPADPFVSHGTGQERSTLDLWGASATLEWTHPAFSLRSISAWRTFDAFFVRDTDASPFAIVTPLADVRQRQYSQEFQLSGTAARLEWLAGLYYLDEKADDDSDFITASFHSQSGGEDITSRSTAAFGQATWHFSERFAFTGGARYTQDRKSYLPTQYFVSSVTGQPPAGLVVIPAQKNTLKESEPTWRAALQYTPAGNWLLYTSWSTGYKSGGFVQRNQAPAPQLPTFAPETVAMFEAGAKATVLDGRLRFAAAAFTGDYQDIQVLTIEPGGYAPITANAGEARIRGGEFEFEALLGAYVSLAGGIGYLDGRYTRIAPNVPAITLDSKLADSPEWSGNLGLVGTVPLARHALSGRVDWSYRSAHFNDAENTPALWQDAYSVLDASLTWQGPRTGTTAWSATLGVRNLTDELYLVTGNQLAVQGPITASYARPREWFLTVAIDL